MSKYHIGSIIFTGYYIIFLIFSKHRILHVSWLEKEAGLAIVNEAAKQPLDEWILPAHTTAVAHLNGEEVGARSKEEVKTDLKGDDLALFTKGKSIYERDGYCVTCHQSDGKGLTASGFPPLAGTKWVLESPERLIKLTLKGLWGPIEVLGKSYPGQVPMTAYGGLLNDDEVAAVLTFVRNSFGNKASVITPNQVKKVRDAIEEKKDFYAPEELLKEHPHQEAVQ